VLQFYTIGAFEMKLNILQSHLSLQSLLRYDNGDTFVETGTYLGDTVKLALNRGYKSIHTIELDDGLYNNAVEVFRSEPRVKVWHGDTIDRLKDIVSMIGPATFWLDAHASGPLVGGRSGPAPVLDELDIIAEHPFKEHTIFIDDCRLFGTQEWSFVKKEDAIKKILQINPNYNIVYLDGHIQGDVLCATIKA
jgi:hypothetical protein